MESKNLTIYFFSGTHWDRAWYQTYQGLRYRLVNTINEIIDTLKNQSGVWRLSFRRADYSGGRLSGN